MALLTRQPTPEEYRVELKALRIVAGFKLLNARADEVVIGAGFSQGSRSFLSEKIGANLDIQTMPSNVQESRSGAPFKPGFGLSGVVTRFPSLY